MVLFCNPFLGADSWNLDDNSEIADGEVAFEISALV